MNIWNMLRGRTEQRAADPSWAALVNGGGGNSTAGAYVDAKSAESLSTVYACVQALSESTACLPLHVYGRTDTGDRERADGHWLSRLLDRPNDWQTGMEFRESQTAAVLLWGNSYAQKITNGAGEVMQLLPLHPARVSIVRLDSGRYRYDYTDDAGKVQRLLADEVLHLKDRTDPGSIVGKSRIQIARESLGLALALRKHGATVFSRGRPSAVIYNEGKRDFTTEELIAFRERLNVFSRSENAGKVMNLLRGMKWENIGISNEDMEWLSAQQFAVADICRIFRVPPVLVQDLTHATYSNVDRLGDYFVSFALQRWLTCWEEGISRSLLGPIARQRYYAEHQTGGLLRAQPKERSEFYKAGIDAGWLFADEVRRLENLPQRDVDGANAADAS
jgi:HK97 family phage portal protein